MDRDHLSHSSTPSRARDAVAPAGPTAAAQTGTAPARVGAALCWLIAALACAWIAWCTAIGPLMRADAGLAAFRWTNGVAFVAMFVVCFGIVWLLVRSAHRAADSAIRTTASLGGAADPAAHLAGRTIALQSVLADPGGPAVLLPVGGRRLHQTVPGFAGRTLPGPFSSFITAFLTEKYGFFCFCHVLTLSGRYSAVPGQIRHFLGFL